MDQAPHSESAELSQRRPIVELLMLAGPTVAQMASYTLMQFVDTWMLAHVGTGGITEPTAASNAGMLAFSIISLGMGVQWVVNTLVSQSFGRQDCQSCGRYLWQGVWFGVGFSLLLLPLLPFVSLPFKAAGHEPALARLETLYLQIVIGASVLKLVSTAFAQFLLAINHAGKVLAATVVGVSMNIVAAWAMIFGHLGFKPVGVAGSAWGQNVGVLFEMATLVVFAFLPHIRRTFFATDWKLRPRMLLTLLRIGVPSGIQVVTEVLAWSLFAMWVMALFGTRTMAANTFMFRYMAVSFMPAYGVSMAVTALVGRYIGMGREDLAHKRADLGFVVAGAIMLSCGLLFFFGRNVLMGLFTQDPQILRTGAMLLVFAAIYQFFDAMYITYNGALRGAGDTFVPAMVTAGLCWGITVVGGYSVARWRPQWGAAGPWTVATAYGVILGFFMLTRFRRGRWRAIAAQNGGIDGNRISQSNGPSAKVSDSQRAALAPERS